MPRPVDDIQADIDKAQAALDAVLDGGHEVQMPGGARVRRADPAFLQRRLAQLRKELDAATAPAGVDSGRHVANVREGAR